jgi:hypothetical protein
MANPMLYPNGLRSGRYIMAAKTVAEARQSSYLMAALRRAHGAVERMKMLSSINIHGFGDGWPSIVSLEDDYQRYGPTYFNAAPAILDFFREHVLPPESNERRREKDEL